MKSIRRYIWRRTVRYKTKHIVIAALLVCSLIGGLLWPYTINTWLVFAGKPPSITFLHGALLGFCPVIGQVTIPIATFTFVLMLFLT